MTTAALVFLAFVIIYATIEIDVRTDYKLWRRGKRINHTRGAALRLIGFIPAGILLYMTGSIYILASGLFFFLAFYWFLFDGRFNRARDMDWWSTGSEDPDDATTDNLLQEMTPGQQKFIKFFLLGAGLAAFGISIFNHTK